MNALPLRITATIFPDLYGKTADPHDIDWTDFVETLRDAPSYKQKADLPLVKLARFGNDLEPGKTTGCLRWDGNVKGVSGIEGDYDAGIMPITEATMLISDAGIEAALTTTPSHTPEKPRYRILVPLSKEYPPEARRGFVAKLNGVLDGGLAPESFGLSQAFYAGKIDGAQYEVQRVRGTPIDLIEGLTEVYPASTNVHESANQKASDGAIPLGGRHRTLTSLAGTMRAKGMAPKSILVALLAENEAHCTPPLPEAEVTRIAADIGAKPAGDPPTNTREPDGVCILNGADVKAEPIDWVWRGFLAKGKLHLLAGPPSTGKTTIGLSWAATMTTGGLWPDGTRAKVADVLIWSGEDSVADTLVPRLIAAGADMKRIHFVHVVIEKGKSRPFSLADDMPALVLAASAIANLGLVLMDPIVVAVKGDSHNNSEVRRGLQPINDLGHTLNCAVLGITHFGKGTAGRNPIERVIGSIAFAAVARVVFAAAIRDQEKGGGRILVRSKSNIGPDGGGFVYDLDVLDQGGPTETTRVQWGEPLVGEARELLAEAEAEPEKPGRVDDDRDDGDDSWDVGDWLLDVLTQPKSPEQPEEWDARTLRRLAGESGYAWRTVQRAAKKLGVTITRVGYGKDTRTIWKPPVAPNSPVAPVAPTNIEGGSDGVSGASGDCSDSRANVAPSPSFGVSGATGATDDFGATGDELAGDLA